MKHIKYFNESLNEGKQKQKKYVAEVMYRDGANYKSTYTFDIPENNLDKIKAAVGNEDGIEVSEFGISEDEWYNEILPSYDQEFDHPYVTVDDVREKRPDDVISNTISN